MSTNEQTLKELYETKQKAEAAIAALEAQRTPSPGLPSLGAAYPAAYDPPANKQAVAAAFYTPPKPPAPKPANPVTKRSTLADLCKEAAELIQEDERLRHELARANSKAQKWRVEAEQTADNRDYYRSIVLEIGEFFGAAARTSDDGSIQQNVLCAKVPSLVRDLLNATNQNP